MTLRKPGQERRLDRRRHCLHPPDAGQLHVRAGLGRSHAGPDYHQAVADITERAGRSRTAGSLYYDACLAIDYLDFAGSAR